MSKIMLAQVSPDAMRAAAKATATAVVTYEKAKLTLLEKVAAAVGTLGVPLSAAQYDKQFKPYLAEFFASAVKSGRIGPKTADQYASKLKTAVLALVNGVAQPVAGEGFFAFYDRAAEAVAKGTLPDGSPIWEASAKRGRKQGAKQTPKAPKPVPGAVAEANASAATADAGGLNVRAELAAALILTHQNKSRAERLVTVMGSYAEEFDRWAATILGERQPKARADKAKEPIVLESGQPATAMAAALVDVQRKANAAAKAA